MQASMYRATDTPQQVNQRIAIGREMAARPCSQLATVPRFMPIRAASFCWLRPECIRAISNALAVLTKYSSINSRPFNKILQNCRIRQAKKWKKLLWRTNSSLCYNCIVKKFQIERKHKMKETAIWNHERMPIIDGMPASVPDGKPHTPEPWEES